MASCIGTWGVQKARVAQTKNRSEAVISRASATAQANSDAPATSSIKIRGIEHYAIIVRNTEKAVEFYQRVLGLPIRPGRPHDNLPYRGAWLALNESQTLHLMELDNPDPVSLEVCSISSPSPFLWLHRARFSFSLALLHE